MKEIRNEFDGNQIENRYYHYSREDINPDILDNQFIKTESFKNTS